MAEYQSKKRKQKLNNIKISSSIIMRDWLQNTPGGQNLRLLLLSNFCGERDWPQRPNEKNLFQENLCLEGNFTAEQKPTRDYSRTRSNSFGEHCLSNARSFGRLKVEEDQTYLRELQVTLLEEFWMVEQQKKQ